MKAFTLIFAFLALCLSGCQFMDSASSGVKERWTARNTGRTHNYTADSKALYNAAVQAAKTLDFRVIKGGPAQGFFDAVNKIQSDNSFSSSRQLSMKVKITHVGEECELRLIINELIEEDSRRAMGMSTETPLVDTPLYEVFFRTVQQNLAKTSK